MKACFGVLSLAATTSLALAGQTNPVAKVVDLISDLQAKIASESDTAQKEFAEYTAWCKDRTANLGHEIKTGKGEVADLKATISSQAANGDALNSKLEELSASLATDEADLKAATEIRAKEAADFAAEEKELSEVLDTLGRAVGILERHGASMLQTAGSVTQALNAMVEAAMFSSADAARLTSLVQSSQQSEDDAVGAPAGAVYEGHSGGILEIMGDLQEKAQTQLDTARSTETASLHNFEMLKQSLQDQIKFANKEKDETEKSLAESSEKKANANSDLGLTSSDLAQDVESLATVRRDCMENAQDFEATTKSRAEESKALAEAKKIISETTGGAASQSYGFSQMSFLQVARLKLSSGADLAKFEAVRIVRDLARKDSSPALAQLASRMASAMRLSSSDPFAKVKGLISDMLDRLETEAAADATKEAYCQKEMSHSKTRKGEKDRENSKLTTKIDQMTSRSAQLKEEVSSAQKALLNLASSQAEMDKMRQEERSAYAKNRPEMEQGLEGIKMALKVLREYYSNGDKAHSAQEGATGIVGLIEVCESDFSKGLAEMVATEDSAEASYVSESNDNSIEKESKEKDVHYKEKEIAGLGKALAEANSDRSGVQTEIDALVGYLAKLDDMCIAKPDTYAERKSRRESELAGLKEALTILDGEALLQKSTRTLNVRRHQ